MNLDETFERRAYLLLLAAVTVLFLLLMRPFLGPVFWAVVIGLLFQRLQRALSRRLGGRESLAALLTLTVCLLGAVVPGLLLLAAFFREAVVLYQRLTRGELDVAAWLDRLQGLVPGLQGLLERVGVQVGDFKGQLTQAAVASSRMVAEQAVQFGQDAFGLLFGLVLMLYLAFFMLRDGPRLVELLVWALPLGDARERRLFERFAAVTRATIKGNFIVAAVQGGLGGLIFWVLGLPSPVLWGVVMTILSLIPVVGAGLVWLPAALYLFATGAWIEGAVLVAFGAGVIGLVDNALRPILVGRDAKLPDYLVLLSTLGGLSLFGMNGFVFGPLVAALFIAVWQEFAADPALRGVARED
ncbi:MAG: AI-2E family transporter [Gammaproteobacteria bacterium]|nr:MAG: AI-2E family transporter [Gammaproteobacteria bacterium]